MKRSSGHFMYRFKVCRYVGYKLKNNAYPDLQEATKKKNAKQKTDHNNLKRGDKFSGYPFENYIHPYDTNMFL